MRHLSFERSFKTERQMGLRQAVLLPCPVICSPSSTGNAAPIGVMSVDSRLDEG